MRLHRLYFEFELYEREGNNETISGGGLCLHPRRQPRVGLEAVPEEGFWREQLRVCMQQVHLDYGRDRDSKLKDCIIGKCSIVIFGYTRSDAFDITFRIGQSSLGVMCV